MNQKLVRIVCAAMLVALLLLLLPACGQVDPMADNGIESVTIEADGSVTVNAIVAADTLEFGEAKKAYLYELLPGESSVQGKTPLASMDVEHRLTFSIPLKGEGTNRLFSSFVVMLDDGTEISARPYYIENPEVLAANRSAFLWKGSPKALKATDVSAAFESGAMHVMLEVGLSELIGADGSFTDAALGGRTASIREASRSGMQVSLSLRLDTAQSYDTLAKILSGLCAYYNGGDNGCVSALFLNMGSGYDDAIVCHYANLSLASQVANGRVYMLSSGKTLDEVKAEYTNLYRTLEESGNVNWGVAVVPDDSVAAWEKGKENQLTPDKLKALSDFLLTSDSQAHADWFSVCGVDYRTLDEEEQAVSYAYLYRVAVESGAGMIFWDAQFDDDCGLYTADGEKRALSSMFESIDLGLNDSDLSLCQTLAGDAWTRLRGGYTSRKLASGIANLGSSGLEEDVLFDFSDGDVHGFFAVASPSDAQTQNSAAFGTPVLYSWVDPNGVAKSGVRRFFDRSEELRGVTTLSVRLLTQAPEVKDCRIVLSMEGVSEGGDRVSFESEILLSNNAWKTVTFQIAAFTGDLDPDSPCVVTLTAQPIADVSTDEPFVLWVRDLYVRYPSDGFERVIPVIIVIAVAALMFAVPILLYLRTLKPKSRRRPATAGKRPPEKRGDR